MRQPPYPNIGIDYPTQLSLYSPHTCDWWLNHRWLVPTRLSQLMPRLRPGQACGQRARSRSQGARDALISHLNWCVLPGLPTASASTSTTTPCVASGRRRTCSVTPHFSLQRCFRSSGFRDCMPPLPAPNSGPNASRCQRGVTRSRCCCGWKGWPPVRIPLGDGPTFMVHHIHAFTIHVTPC